MSYICALLLLLFNITLFLCYALFKVRNNIQLVTKVCRLIIHLPPPPIIPISNNWYHSIVTLKRLNNLSKIPIDMEQLKKNLEEALEKIDLLTEERDKLKDRYEEFKV